MQPVEKDLEELKRAARGLQGSTFEERQRSFERSAATVWSGARRIAARTNELGISTAAEMRAIADVVSVPPCRLGFSCYEPTLAQRLRQAADQADDPVVLKLRTAEFAEGPAGVANAVKRLWENIGAYAGSLVTYVMNGLKTPETSTDEG